MQQRSAAVCPDLGESVSGFKVARAPFPHPGPLPWPQEASACPLWAAHMAPFSMWRWDRPCQTILSPGDLWEFWLFVQRFKWNWNVALKTKGLELDKSSLRIQRSWSIQGERVGGMVPGRSSGLPHCNFQFSLSIFVFIKMVPVMVNTPGQLAGT